MTREEIISGLEFTAEMFLFDPSTGEKYTEPRNDMDKTTIDACRGAIELLKQKPTTKNDLGVDCISRADAIKAMQDKAKELKNEDTINGLCGAVAILFDMPSVTPQEPRKGHWIEHPHEAGPCWEYSRYECSECHEWEEDDSDYCPDCGAKMVEPQESER